MERALDYVASDAPVAQQEEQWVSNPLAGGSSPSGRATFRWQALFNDVKSKIVPDTGET